MAKSLQDSSTYFITAICLIVVAIILQAVALATPNWIVFSYEGVVGTRTGLWRSCSEVIGLVLCEESNFRGEGWFIAVQVLETVGLAFTVISLILSMVLFLAVTSKLLVKVNINICSIGGSCIGIGLTIFVIKTFTDDSLNHGHFGYSYWLAIAAMLVLCIVSGLLWCDKRKSGRANL
ncbi:uncharacterized protein LOC132737067 [Ruditapes philippinarum]|uniref:uncharacterized protein LOC132737067 n=1 Tax=Ruditapes philippinarum TaxID=129788 RepID=UPI00295A59BC|nr:uncharacterized protein LOC132737067 [Ruditapes philippinarum]